jgi:hypothetical protein
MAPLRRRHFVEHTSDALPTICGDGVDPDLPFLVAKL